MNLLKLKNHGLALLIMITTGSISLGQQTYFLDGNTNTTINKLSDSSSISLHLRMDTSLVLGDYERIRFKVFAIGNKNSGRPGLEIGRGELSYLNLENRTNDQGQLDFIVLEEIDVGILNSDMGIDRVGFGNKDHIRVEVYGLMENGLTTNQVSSGDSTLLERNSTSVTQSYYAEDLLGKTAWLDVSERDNNVQMAKMDKRRKRVLWGVLGGIGAVIVTTIAVFSML